jgi:hypothetical protein
VTAIHWETDLYIDLSLQEGQCKNHGSTSYQSAIINKISYNSKRKQAIAHSCCKRGLYFPPTGTKSNGQMSQDMNPTIHSIRRNFQYGHNLAKKGGCAVAQTISHQLPTAVGQIRAWVRSCGICGGQSGTGAGFLRVLEFPLPSIPPTAPHSSSSIIWSWYSRPNIG